MKITTFTLLLNIAVGTHALQVAYRAAQSNSADTPQDDELTNTADDELPNTADDELPNTTDTLQDDELPNTTDTPQDDELPNTTDTPQDDELPNTTDTPQDDELPNTKVKPQGDVGNRKNRSWRVEVPDLLLPRIRQEVKGMPDIMVTDEFCLMAFRLPFAAKSLRFLNVDATAGVTEIVVFADPKLRGVPKFAKFTFLTPKECWFSTFSPYVCSGAGGQLNLAVRRKTDIMTPMTVAEMMTRVTELYPDAFPVSSADADGMSLRGKVKQN